MGSEVFELTPFRRSIIFCSSITVVASIASGMMYGLFNGFAIGLASSILSGIIISLNSGEKIHAR